MGGFQKGFIRQAESIAHLRNCFSSHRSNFLFFSGFVSFHAMAGILSAGETVFGPKPDSLFLEINVGCEQYLIQILWVR